VARKNPALPSVNPMPRDKHEAMLDEMHGALYALGDKIRKPYPRSGDKLLPTSLQESDSPEAKAAREHIECLHKAMKAER
jgi:hypothetical protein